MKQQPTFGKQQLRAGSPRSFGVPPWSAPRLITFSKATPEPQPVSRKTPLLPRTGFAVDICCLCGFLSLARVTLFGLYQSRLGLLLTRSIRCCSKPTTWHVDVAVTTDRGNRSAAYWLGWREQELPMTTTWTSDRGYRSSTTDTAPPCEQQTGGSRSVEREAECVQRRDGGCPTNQCGQA
jgi:hypothetical protein